MKKTTNVATLQGNKTATSKPTKVSANVLTQKSTTKQETTKKESEHKQRLNRWAKLKDEKGKIGYCIDIVKSYKDIVNLTTKELNTLNSLKKDAKPILNVIKPNKKGNYNAYQVFMNLHKLI
jgi:hypothetical protein